jgi:hypothetical protein
MVSMWFAFSATKDAVVRAYQFAMTNRIVNGTLCYAAFREFLMVLLNDVRKAFAIIRPPLSIRLRSVESMSLPVIFDPPLHAFVLLFGVSLSVLAVPLLVFFEVCKSVFSLILLACFRIFEWHDYNHTTNILMSGGFDAR